MSIERIWIGFMNIIIWLFDLLNTFTIYITDDVSITLAQLIMAGIFVPIILKIIVSIAWGEWLLCYLL